MRVHCRALQDDRRQQDHEDRRHREETGPLARDRCADGGAGGDEPPHAELRLDVAERQVDGKRRGQRHVHVEDGEAGVQHEHRVRGGEYQRRERPFVVQPETAGQREHESDEGDAAQRSWKAPAPGIVAEDGDPGGDGKLGEVGVCD